MELDDGDAAISRASVLISIEKRGIPRAVSIADNGLEILLLLSNARRQNRVLYGKP